MSKGKSTTTSSTEIDPQLMAIYKDVYNTGKTIANQPYLPYTGPRVAGFNPDQLTGFDATRNMFGQSMGYDPRGSLNTLANMSTPTVSPFTGTGNAVNRGAIRNLTPQNFLNANLQGYQNPYTQQVVDTTLADLDRSRQMTLNRNADSAIGANAFGGSRQGVVEAETNRAFADQAARTAAGLRQSGFDRATSLAGQDIGRDFSAQQMMSDADRAVAFQNAQAGNQFGLANLGYLNQAATLQPQLEMQNRSFQSGLFGNQLADQYNNVGLLSGIGGQQQQFQQQALNQAYGQYADAMGYGQKQLGLLSQAAGLIPQQSTTTQTGQQKTGAGDVLGTAAQLAAAIWSGGGTLFGSDERMKKDITFIGKEKGHNIYSWNWNDKAKSIGWDKFPTVGVIAQEVKKYMPEAVIQDANGYYKVNYGVL